MHSLLSTYPLRHCQLLDGLWEFYVVENGRSPDLNSTEGTRRTLAVPGVWESCFDLFEFRGQGLYSREFETREEGDYRLIFGCVSHTARVWLDGAELGSHYGPHTPFEFILQRLRPGMHKLQVLADNSFGPHNPLTRACSDIYTYGGIVRSVVIEQLPDRARFEAIRAVPTKRHGEWTIDVSLQVAGDEFDGIGVRCFVDGTENAMWRLDSPAAKVTLQMPEQPRLWSPESPHLHVFAAELVDLSSGNALDRFQQRIGFRQIECRGADLLLNGKPIRLAGVNRHEFHPDFGPALPLTVHLRDLEILRRLGANFVRTSHYPADPLFLDLCDEMGFLVWEELSHWQPKADDLGSAAFLEASLRELEEMVSRDAHHPCILLWGMLNEADAHREIAHHVAQTLAERFRALDGTRPVTYASMTDDDLCHGVADVISRNLYPGWYGGRLDAVAPSVEGVVQHLREQSGSKPIILSEFGAAAGAGVRSFELRKWTEDYQAELLTRVIDTAARLDVAGVCVWQFCDVRTSPEHGLDRYREYNNKGLVDEHRQPKLAFDPVGSAMSRFLRR